MYRRILLTLDGSELARSAIPHARELARDADTEVVIVQVIDTKDMARTKIAPMATIFATGGESVDDLAESALSAQHQAAHDELKKAHAQLEAGGVKPVTTHVLSGLPGNEIVEAAAKFGCQAIVMATRGHSGLGRDVLGSVSEYVVRHAGPVAVVLVGPRAMAAASGR